MTRLHQWDVLRANKAPFAFGLETRVPFLDKQFLQVGAHTRGGAGSCSHGVAAGLLCLPPCAGVGHQLGCTAALSCPTCLVIAGKFAGAALDTDSSWLPACVVAAAGCRWP